jgi:threonine/homoserine/homoserine lactone efflux protein
VTNTQINKLHRAVFWALAVIALAVYLVIAAYILRLSDSVFVQILILVGAFYLIYLVPIAGADLLEWLLRRKKHKEEN